MPKDEEVYFDTNGEVEVPPLFLSVSHVNDYATEPSHHRPALLRTPTYNELRSPTIKVTHLEVRNYTLCFE